MSVACFRAAFFSVVRTSVFLSSGFLFSGESPAEDGLRKVEVQRFGISVRVPAAWEPIDLARNERAFVLKLPQDAGTTPAVVACELGVAPENLDEFHKRHQANDEQEQKRDSPRRKLIHNRIETLAPEQWGKENAEKLGKRLVSIWRYTTEGEPENYEIRVRVISEGALYSFVLAADQAHFEAYRHDFEDMLKRAVFTQPETGLQRMPDGYWMQRDFHFALKLPDGWKPAFGPDDKVLFFAVGKSHQVFSDNLLVLASGAKPLDLDKLQKELPGEIAKVDPASQTADCRIVPQGGGQALETVIHTKRGPFEITILERRFQAQERNYEVKFTCETAEFKKIEVELRQALDSFREVPKDKGKRLL